MTLPKNFLASVYLAAALAGVAVITAAVGQTTQATTMRVASADSHSVQSQSGKIVHQH